MIIANTILCLTASCLTTFIVSGLLGHKFEIEAIINATLAGGVMIGAPSGVLYNPGISVAIGVVAGGLSTLGFRYVTKAL